MNYLNPFQSGFRPNSGTEKALITLVDDLRQKQDVDSASILALLDFSVVFNTINYPFGPAAEFGSGQYSFALVFSAVDRE